MTDRGIIFSAPMVLALLAGRKTQTRRLATSPLRRTQIGDRLYVRETFSETTAVRYADRRMGVTYRADLPVEEPPLTNPITSARLLWVTAPRPFRPSIHMPRWASRLTLIVTDVRVQPLQAISGVDAVAEGVRSRLPDSGLAQAEFRDLWDSLHDKPGERWADNPDLIALSFIVRPGNIDRLEP